MKLTRAAYEAIIHRDEMMDSVWLQWRAEPCMESTFAEMDEDAIGLVKDFFEIGWCAGMVYQQHRPGGE